MNPAGSTADRLRAAREAAGLSRAGLASRMGASWETVRRAETDRDPRASTLAAWIRALPFATPAGLLGADDLAPPLASRAAWAFHRRVLGFHVERVVLTMEVLGDGARRLRQSWHGVRSSRFDLSDDGLRTNLLRAVVALPAEELRTLAALPADRRGTTRRFEAAGAQHVVRFARPLHRGLSWESESPAEPHRGDPVLRGEELPGDAETMALDVEAAIERLELVVRLPAGCAPPSVRAFAAPSGILAAAGAFRFAEDLYPRGFEASWSDDRRELRVATEHPQPHVRHGIAWDPTGRAAGFVPVPAGRSGRSSTVFALGRLPGPAACRTAAGMSVRAVAARCGGSPATVIAMESGDDVRATTLQRVLAALPGLRPAALMAEAGAEGELSPQEAWLVQRALHGACAAECRRSVVIDADGNAREEIGVHDLRWTASGARVPDLVVRDAIARAVAGKVGDVLVEGAGSARRAGLRIRWQRLPGEQEEFSLVIPAALAGTGASYMRRERKAGAYKTRPEQSGRSIGPAFECLVPAELLTLDVQLPRAMGPVEVKAFARASVAVTNPRWPDLSADLHPEGFALAWDPRRRHARLSVQRPLLGVRYSVAWRLA